MVVHIIQTSVSLLPNTPDVQHIEIYHYIPVVCFVVDHGYENPNRVVASQPHYSFDFSVLTGLHNLARVGDQLTVRFQLANNTTTMETHGLCHDSCFVQIIRKGKILTEMLLSDSVAPKYAWGGRMIDNYYRPTPVVADQEQCSI